MQKYNKLRPKLSKAHALLFTTWTSSQKLNSTHARDKAPCGSNTVRATVRLAHFGLTRILNLCFVSSPSPLDLQPFCRHLCQLFGLSNSRSTWKNWDILGRQLSEKFSSNRCLVQFNLTVHVNVLSEGLNLLWLVESDLCFQSPCLL